MKQYIIALIFPLTFYGFTWIRITCGYYVIPRPALMSIRLKKWKPFELVFSVSLAKPLDVGFLDCMVLLF